MTAVTAPPQVTPFFTPLRKSGASLSRRAVANAPRPGARRVRKALSASISMAKPTGSPSITTPMASPCEAPKIVMRKFFPRLLTAFPPFSKR